MSNNADNFARLANTLGFDPTKPERATEALLKEVTEELQEKRREEAKERAKKVMAEAITLSERQAEAERQFNSNKKKWNKELGKLLNRLNAGVGGGQSEDEEESED